MADDDVLVQVEGVSKRFCRDLKRSLWYGVQDTLSDFAVRETDNPSASADYQMPLDRRLKAYPNDTSS